MADALFHLDNLANASVGQELLLEGREAKHALQARRINIGEVIWLGDGNGTIARGPVIELAKTSLRINVESLEKKDPPATKITLVQALAKGDRDELAIQAATELGITQVIPWQAERSVSIWKGEKVQKGTDRWQSIVQEATKQSLRAYCPQVLVAVDTETLIEELKSFDRVYVLEPTGEQTLVGQALEGVESIAVVVGPEGGVSETELSLFGSAGFSTVRLGISVLRTSTAGVAAIAYLQSQLGDWG